MSATRMQAMLDVPIDAVWALVADPARYPEWWPRFVEVESPPGMEEGCTFPAVTATPFGQVRNRLCVERLDDCRELHIRCLTTGARTRWLLTEARGGTFVDAEFGMEPKGRRDRILDPLIGRRYFRRWLEQSLEALGAAAAGTGVSGPAGAADRAPPRPPG